MKTDLEVEVEVDLRPLGKVIIFRDKQTDRSFLLYIDIITFTIFIISATHFVILNIIVIIVTLVKRKQSLVDATDDLVLADSREEKEIAFSADFSVTTSNQSNCFGQTCHFKTRTMRNSVHSRH